MRRATAAAAASALDRGGPSPVAPQQRPGELAAVVDLRLHGAERRADQRGDLVVGQPVDVAQQQRLDELRVVALDRLHRLQQVEPRAGDDAGRARVGPVVGAVLEVGGRGEVLQPAVGRARTVDRHDVQPRGEPAAAAPGVDLGGDVEHRLLARVLRVAGVGEHPAADVEHPRAHLREQPLERVTVAVTRPSRQLVDVVLRQRAPWSPEYVTPAR